MKQRNSSIELLRVFLMLMIVLSHASCYGIAENVSKLFFNNYILRICLLGKWAVAAFIIIFGFYGINSSFNAKRLANLYMPVLFYSVFFFGGACAVTKSFPAANAIRVIFPILSGQYWFFTVYFMLSILAPFINGYLQSLTREKHYRFIKLAFIVFCIFPMGFLTFIDSAFKISNLGTFVLLYFIGAYMGKYPDCLVMKKRTGYFCVIGAFAFIMIYNYLELKNVNLLKIDWGSVRSVPGVVFAIGIFSVFKNLNVRQSKFINVLGKCTFGVYLIHDNAVLRPHLWKILNSQKYLNTPYLFLHMLVCTVIVFMICVLVELIRQKTIHKFLCRVFGDRCSMFLKSVNRIIKP